MSDPILGHRDFTDGVRRAVFLDGERQYVLGYDGEKVYGIWLLPPEEIADTPLIVDQAFL